MHARKKIRDIKVEAVMTRDVVTVGKDATLKELKELFDKHNFNAFPVMEDNKVVGIVTKLDLLKTVTIGLTFSRTKYWDLFAEKVGDIMRKVIVSVKPTDTLESAAEYMVEFKLRSLPVLTNGRLLGMISRDDIVKHLFGED